jgi:uncharacterized phiE125 gp8 family phage protein
LIYTVSTAPTDEPLTLVEAKEHLRVDDAADDDLIANQRKAARVYVETVLGRQLMLATWNLYLDSFPSGDTPIYVPLPPLLSVVSITYVDTDGVSQTEASTVYTVDTDREPGRIYLAYDQSWSDTRSQRKAVTVQFTAGYSSGNAAAQQLAVPQTIKAAILFVLADLYENREAELDAQTYHNETVDRPLWSERLLEVA